MTLTRARPLLLLAALVFLPRLFLAWYLGVAGNPEIWEYDVIGACIHAGLGHIYEINGLRYLAYAPPLWSYILAGLMGLPGDSRGWIQVAQAIFCLGAALAAAGIGRRLSGRDGVGVACGALVALQPSLLYYSVVKSDPLPLNVLLVCVIALAGMRTLEAPSWRKGLAFGLLAALGTLARGTPAVALPTLAVLMVARWRRRALVPLIAAALTFAAGVSPWLIRNHVLLGSPILTSTTGENLWRGNNAAATGGAFDVSGRSLSVASAAPEAFPPSIRAALATGVELERQEAFLDEVRRFVRERPASAVRLFVRKLRILWWRLESAPDDYWPRAAQTYEWIYRAELSLALVGVWTLWRNRTGTPVGSGRWEVLYVLLLGLTLSVLQALFYVQGRHRFLIEPLLLIFTAVGTHALARRGLPPRRP